MGLPLIKALFKVVNQGMTRLFFPNPIQKDDGGLNIDE